MLSNYLPRTVSAEEVLRIAPRREDDLIKGLMAGALCRVDWSLIITLNLIQLRVTYGAHSHMPTEELGEGAH